MHHLVVVVHFPIGINHHQLHIYLEAAVAAEIQLRFLQQQTRLEKRRHLAVETQADAAGGKIMYAQLIRRAVRVFAGAQKLAPVRRGNAELTPALNIDQLLRQAGRTGGDA